MHNQPDSQCVKDADAFATLILPLICAISLLTKHEYIYIGTQLEAIVSKSETYI